MSNPLLYQTLVLPIDGTAALPSIQVGGAPGNSSGVGIYGDYSGIFFSVGGVQVAGITEDGFIPVADADANTVLAGPATGPADVPAFRALVAADIPSIDLSSGVTGVLPVANGGTGTSSAAPQILVYTSAASAGSNPTEVMVLTGILATDTILSVSQSVPGANNLPLIGFNTLANDALTAVYSADPGAGAVIKVAVKR